MQRQFYVVYEGFHGEERCEPRCAVTPCTFPYTGWPRKKATLSINNLKKTRGKIKKLCALLRIKFFFQ